MMIACSSLRVPAGGPAAASAVRRRHVSIRAGLLDLFTGGPPNPAAIEDTSAAGLLSNLRAAGLPPQPVMVARFTGYPGRGLAAAAPIQRGGRALQVPKPLVLSPAVAASALPGGQQLAEELPAWSVLALWLMCARAAATADAPAAAECLPAWQRSYAALLPDSTGGVLEWPQSDIALLCGSYLHDLALEIGAAADASWQEMVPAAAQLERAMALPVGAFSEAAARWAFGLLLSRTVRLPGLGGAEALVPLADFANHACEASAFLDWDAAAEAVVLQTDRPYRAGEQVVISYGQKTSGQLLLSYGFAPPVGRNPHDACLLRATLDAADPARGWKEAALAERGLDGTFPLRLGAIPEQALALAAFAAAPAGSAEEVVSLASQLLGAPSAAQQQPGRSLDSRLRQLGTERLAAWCKAAAARFPRGLAEDQAELAALEAQLEGAEAVTEGGGAAARRLAVLRAVVADRQVLARASFLLQQSLREQRRLRRGR